MMPTHSGSFRLFKLWGITVYLHWSWLVVAFYSISIRVPGYESPVWAVGEYLTLFLVVLMHEFGHSLASRQVGGKSDQIVLWPLGGVAYVAPPPRPGAELWSIAAGPLVNVVLVPVFVGAFYALAATELFAAHPDLYRFMRAILYMNFSLLAFNLLPVYPLDGGQILRSLLWYGFGRARSLQIATGLGLVGGVGIIAGAVWLRSWWLGAVAYFLLTSCWQGFQQARELRRIEKIPRHGGFKCPVCHAAPPAGAYWICQNCRQPFDPFVTDAKCPHCAAVLDLTACPDCQNARPQRSWDASIRDA